MYGKKRAYPSMEVLPVNKREAYGLGAILVIGVIFFFVCSAVRFNLAATAAALAEEPITIVVDPGHGGEDGGATSVSGIQESQINLSISLRLEQLLAFIGIKPMMIRDTDVAVYTGNCRTISEKKVSDLKNRVQTVNAVNNGLLISIHQNHFGESKYSGAQVFYAKTNGSKDLAGCTQAQLRAALNPSNNREIKVADSVYLMEHIQCTGILVECGFLSNSKEDMLLQNATYQKKLVCAVCAGLTQYLTKGETQNEV